MREEMSLCYTDVLQCKDLGRSMGDFLHLSNTAAELNQSVRVSALLTVQ